MKHGEHRGVVVARYRRHVAVEDASGRHHLCQTRGRRLDPLAGDEVHWQAEAGDRGVVTAVLPRRSALTRIDSRGKPEMVAANISQLLAVAAPQPAPDWFLIDRYLAAGELANIRCAVVFNKVDLAAAPPAQLESYRSMGYPVHLTSAATRGGMEVLAASMCGQRSVMAGQSGVGKSSLINALVGDAVQAVGELSSKGGHGKHTTTTAILYRLPTGGELIDSPGVRNFAPHIADPANLGHAFRDFRTHLGSCRFADCLHLAEPGCGVKRAVDEGAIDPRRYESYRRLHSLALSLQGRH